MANKQAVAAEIFRQHSERETFTTLPDDMRPASIEEAYQTQFALHALHADHATGRGKLGGRKIALASKVQQELCGIDHPIAGGVFAREIVVGTLDNPAKLALSEYHGLGLEFELAVKMSQDVSADDGPFTADNVAPFVASLHPAFEAIIDRDADYSAIDPITMVCDNAWCAAVVLGPALAGWQSLSLRAQINAMPVSLQWNGEDPQTETFGATDPLDALAWVMDLVTSQGQSMRKGDVVITGSVIKTRAPLVGDKIAFSAVDPNGDSQTVALDIL